MTTETERQWADPTKGEFFNNGDYAKEGGWRGGGTFRPEYKKPQLPNTHAARTDTPLAREFYRLVPGG
ncbi:MAG: hypothetical protein JO266_03725 [Acidobacteria bacterium]|jgi:hypothetical protein|nr:hypothetical protein [Acidobacteriota bacterium]MBV9482919.1 hypothetical protein [Acidobacteriota bacterium]